MSTTPGRPLDQYPDAEAGSLPSPPPPGLPGEPQEAAPPAKPAATPREIAALDFLRPENSSRKVSLEHPFRWEGEVVTEITIKRLTLAEVGQLAQQIAPDRTIDAFDVYAAMTGYSPAVLRGLICEDGEAVIDACAPFLPRIVVDLLFAETSASGENTPSS